MELKKMSIDLVSDVLNHVGKIGMITVDGLCKHFAETIPEPDDMVDYLSILISLDFITIIQGINAETQVPMEKLYMISQKGLDWILAQAKVHEMFDK